ncbi:MBL fold metallo-hydrolase [Candidatus Bathyarchaeota archaeon]|nr:MBL fold metallo-hydrolase [Candidatus Bathyarchaeota archaeon]
MKWLISMKETTGVERHYQVSRLSCKGVNAYLVQLKEGCILIDTGFVSKREKMDSMLEKRGCKYGDIKLILLTHGDADHAGNAAYLRDRHGAPIAMHELDVDMVSSGNMSWNRKKHNDKVGLGFKIISFFSRSKGIPERDRFSPEVTFHGGESLKDHGFMASILHVPGHSAGSIAILSKEGDLFCGDLLVNITRVRLHFFIDDMNAALESLHKIDFDRVARIFPGHGRPFKPFKALRLLT